MKFMFGAQIKFRDSDTFNAFVSSLAGQAPEDNKKLKEVYDQKVKFLQDLGSEATGVVIEYPVPGLFRPTVFLKLL